MLLFISLFLSLNFFKKFIFYFIFWPIKKNKTKRTNRRPPHVVGSAKQSKCPNGRAGQAQFSCTCSSPALHLPFTIFCLQKQFKQEICMQFNIFCFFVKKAGDLHADLIRQHLVVLICFFFLVNK